MNRPIGYAISQRRPKMVEEVFGWTKTVGLMRRLRHRGTRLTDWMLEFAPWHTTSPE